MALQNQWVTYLDRSFKSIKTSILNKVKVLVPEMTDLSETNLFVIITSIFSGLVEQINYYIDNLARESYITTARRFSSMYALTRLIDYRIRASVPSSTDLKITALNGSDPETLVNNYTFPQGMIVKDATGIEFQTTRAITMFANTSTVTVGAKQVKQVLNFSVGVTNTSPKQTFKLSTTYAHDTLQITIQGNTWELRRSFSFSGPLDKHFIVEVNENKEAWVVFGDNINGVIPPTGQSVLATYYDTLGSNGNLAADTITGWDTVPTPPTQVPPITSFSITNSLDASGGLLTEGIEDIRRHAPLSLRTLDRAVTFQDYQDIAELVPGVGKAAAKLNTRTKAITIYIAPDEGGTASLALRQAVEAELTSKGIIGAIISAQAAGETTLRIAATVTAKYRRDKQETHDDILDALITAFGFNNSDVNKSVRQSDIIALIDNLDKVNYLSLTKLTTKPYPRIYTGTNNLENNWYIEVMDKNTVIMEWKITILSPTTARLYGKVLNGIEYVDGEFSYGGTDPGVTNYESNNGEINLSIWGTFTIGNQWVFYTYPYNKDIELQDYTIPVIKVGELAITVV